MNRRPTQLAWRSGARPWCTTCGLTIRVYMVFADGSPVVLGTWCPSCDAYSSNDEHWASWRPDLPIELPSRVELKVPQNETAWEFARTFMQGDGERKTRSSL